jgi:hypothetical protein
MKKTLVVLALVGALALAVGVSSYAYAQGNQPPVNPFDHSGRFADRSQGKMGGELLGTYMHDAIAGFLGVTPDELTALHESGGTMHTLLDQVGLTFEAFRAQRDQMRTAAMAAALADGAVTQEQIDLMTDRANRQGGFDRRAGIDRPGGFMNGGVIDSYMHAALADILGLSIEELDTLHASGETVQTLLTEQGFPFEEIGEKRAAARAAALAAAEADGVITQEQADLMQNHIQNTGGKGHRRGFGQ